MQENMDHRHWLSRAIRLARQAAEENEVPVGAVVVHNNEIIGEGYNQPIKRNDPTAHAEIIALRQAGGRLGNYRLLNTTIYTTLEPCAMCVGAIIHARIGRLVFGAYDQKMGFVANNSQLLDLKNNHQVSWEGGLLAEDCAHLLQQFFQARR